MCSQTREVTLRILDSIMFSSVSVVPFHSKPCSAGPIYLPYISDSPNVAREREASTHSREAAHRGHSVVSRGAKGGHIRLAARQARSTHAVKVGRSASGELRVAAGWLNLFLCTNFQLRGQVPGPIT